MLYRDFWLIGIEVPEKTEPCSQIMQKLHEISHAHKSAERAHKKTDYKQQTTIENPPNKSRTKTYEKTTGKKIQQQTTPNTQYTTNNQRQATDNTNSLTNH